VIEEEPGNPMYTWNAEEYNKSSSAQLNWALELIGKLDLKGNERVLDIGCGDGKVSLEIARKVAQGWILGIDNSQEMIKYAQQAYPATTYPNMRFRTLDALHLDFDSEFDVIFSNAALHWVKDHIRLLRGVEKSLKKNGRLLFQMGGKGNAQAIVDIIQAMIETNKWNRFFRNFSFPYGFYGPEEYNLRLLQAGFTPRRVELIPKDMAQMGKEGLASWVRTTWLPYTQRLPIWIQEDFIAGIVEAYTTRFPPDVEGFVHVEMVRLEVEAVK